MNYKIETTKVNKSRLSEIDFDNIPFGKLFSDHMFSADYIDLRIPFYKQGFQLHELIALPFR